MRPSWGLVCLAFVIAAGCGGGTGTYRVSGTVTTSTVDGGTVGVPGVIVTLRTKVASTVVHPVIITESSTTDAQGRYSIASQNGSYTLAPLLDGWAFGPDATGVDVGGRNIDQQDFFGVNTALHYIQGELTGTVFAGVAVAVEGPVSATLTTDQDGFYFIGPVPAGDYSITPQPTTGSSFPAAAQVSVGAGSLVITEADFLVTPPASEATVAISGDAASGVTDHLFQTVVPFSPNFLDAPTPSIVVYDPTADQFRFAMFFDPSGHDGALGGDFGGDVVFPGHPLAASYGPSQASRNTGAFNSFGECWAGTTFDVGWFDHGYTLTFTSVGDPQAVPPLNVIYYPVHGTLHVACLGSSRFTSPPPPPGTVSVDVAF
jgi:hypothetical protein